MQDHKLLYKEATVVGVALVPMWYAVRQFTIATMILNTSPEYKAMLDVAIAGFLFHLTAEETGVNNYYLTNSYAYQKSFSSKFKDESLDTSGARSFDGIGTVFGFKAVA